MYGAALRPNDNAEPQASRALQWLTSVAAATLARAAPAMRAGFISARHSTVLRAAGRAIDAEALFMVRDCIVAGWCGNRWFDVRLRGSFAMYCVRMGVI